MNALPQVLKLSSSIEIVIPSSSYVAF
uniref:Uncharacterized protein n=1 Tax=Anguilla anguilla TaxID=7936 RepID=A0A0E9S1P1_ANGAN